METSNESIKVAGLFQEIMQLYKQNMSKLLDGTGMSLPQCMVLGLLNKNKKMNMSELSNQLCLANSTVSGIIDRLEKQEMVVKERSEKDKRIVYVIISPKAEKLNKNFYKLFEKNIQDMMSQGNKEELHKISEGLNVLKKLLSS